MNSLDRLADDPAAVAALDAQQAQTTLVRLLALQTALLTRILQPPAVAAPPQEQRDDDSALLTAREVAARLNVSVRWIYRNHRNLPFTRKLTGKALRFDRRGLYKYLRLNKII